MKKPARPVRKGAVPSRRRLAPRASTEQAQRRQWRGSSWLMATPTCRVVLKTITADRLHPLAGMGRLCAFGLSTGRRSGKSRLDDLRWAALRRPYAVPPPERRAELLRVAAGVVREPAANRYPTSSDAGPACRRAVQISPQSNRDRTTFGYLAILLYRNVCGG